MWLHYFKSSRRIVPSIVIASIVAMALSVIVIYSYGTGSSPSATVDAEAAPSVEVRAFLDSLSEDIVRNVDVEMAAGRQFRDILHEAIQLAKVEGTVLCHEQQRAVRAVVASYARFFAALPKDARGVKRSEYFVAYAIANGLRNPGRDKDFIAVRREAEQTLEVMLDRSMRGIDEGLGKVFGRRA